MHPQIFTHESQIGKFCNTLQVACKSSHTETEGTHWHCPSMLPNSPYLAKTYYYWFALQKNKPLGKIFEVDADKGRRLNLKSRNMHVVSVCSRFGVQLHTGNIQWKYCLNYSSPCRLLSLLTVSTRVLVVGRDKHMAELRNIMQASLF